MGSESTDKVPTIGLVDTSLDLGSGQVTQLKERFSLWSTVGLLYSVTNTPVMLGTFLATVVGVGGSPVFIWGYILSFALNMCVCTSLAEIAAVYPHASGECIDIAPLFSC